MRYFSIVHVESCPWAENLISLVHLSFHAVEAVKPWVAIGLKAKNQISWVGHVLGQLV